MPRLFLFCCSPVVLLSLILASCMEGPVGPRGPQGEKGDDGESLAIFTRTGTVLSKNYTAGNASYASIWLCSSCTDPTVLFVGIENTNGAFTNTEWAGVIYAGTDPTYGYDGLSGYYVVVYDPTKALLQKNYRVKVTY